MFAMGSVYLFMPSVPTQHELVRIVFLIRFCLVFIFVCFVCCLFVCNIQNTLDSCYRSWIEELSQAFAWQYWDFCPVILQRSLHFKIWLPRSYQSTCGQGHIKLSHNDIRKEIIYETRRAADFSQF